MSQMQHCIFIGGCADGTTQFVDVEQPFLIASDLNEQARIQREEYFDRIKNIPDSVTFHQHTYRRERIVLNANRTIVIFYVYEGISLLNALHLMIEYYSGKKERKERRETT